MKKCNRKIIIGCAVLLVLSLFCFICCAYECDYFRLMMEFFKGTENEQPLTRDFVLMLISSIFSLIICIADILALICILRAKASKDSSVVE